jgi:O-acetylhomoserine (thiol)-lyase
MVIPPYSNTNPCAAFPRLCRYYAVLAPSATTTCSQPEFGPRLRIVSVITDMPLEPDPVMDKDLCINCMLCAKKAPPMAFPS